MARVNRRTMLKGAAAAALAGASGARVFAVGGETADLIVKNGAIVTMNEKTPFAEAMAVRGGRVLAVGSERDVTPHLGRATTVVDAGGKGVSPGLIDAHSHLVAYGHMELDFVIVRPPKVNSFETLNRELAAAAKKTPADEWIVARGFNNFKEGRFPRRWELDGATPNHPVLVIHWSGQYGIANTLALKKAKILSKDVQDPYGGKFLRSAKDGLPDGVLLHYPAIYAVYEPKIGEEDQIKRAAWGAQKFLREGVTCVHDNFCVSGAQAAYVRMERMNQLACRVRAYPYVANLQQCQTGLQKLKRYNGPLVRIQGIKLAVDGYALMYDVPETQRHLAIPMHPQPLFEQIIDSIHKAGYQVDVHAVGDKGVDWTLQAFAKAAGSAAECGRRRHRIEHFPFRKLDTIRRAAELGVPVCEQPNVMEVRGDDFADRLGARGEEYVRTFVPLQTFAKEGVRIAFGADVPAFPSLRPLDSIRSAMERKTGSGRALDMSEAVSFLEALRLQTIGSAYAAFDEKELGSLEPGKLADFVLWDRDLREVKTAQEANALKVQATYLAGKAVYEAKA